jgi:hypothetical protein
MPLIKNKALNLTEREIRYAMANSRSNKEASRFIGCHFDTYRIYAKRYIDEETGKTLWDLHKNPSGKGVPKNNGTLFFKKDIFEILDGKHPKYNRGILARRIIDECIFPEECAVCGFNEKRITDYKVPLILIWKDGDLTNHRRENLEFICYNCYFLTYDDVFHKTERVNFKGY